MEESKLWNNQNNDKVSRDPKLEWTICNFIEQTRDNIWKPLQELDINETVNLNSTILVIDDEPQLLDFMKMALEMRGYHVILAKSWTEWLRKYEEYNRQINLVILDLTMPDIYGQEVYERMLKIKDDVNVIISSWHCFERIREWTLSKAQWFLVKPFSLIELYLAVNEVLKDKNGNLN